MEHNTIPFRGTIPRLLFFRTASVIFLLVITWAAMMPRVSAQASLSQEALADLVKPSVVRIAGHITGTAKIPEIKVDIRKRLVAVVPEQYTEIPVDEYLVGSGFIIHPDGYIATNTHVVSEETIKQELASENALSALYENALFLSDEEMREFLQSETDNSFSKQVLEYVIQHSVFTLKSERTVFRPDSDKQAIADLIAEGFPAVIVSMNDNFLEDERDIALLRIEADHLPALALGTSESLVVGKKAFIFGFPATAELTRNSSVEATFTQGVVSAIKQSSERNFKLFQTDAKVSEGSSGGPLFDEEGSVTGMVTFQTDELSRGQGDTFAFALPVELVKQTAKDAGISLVEGEYGKYFKQGLDDLSLKRCNKATQKFRSALAASNVVFVSEGHIATYFKQCDELQKTGMSLDTRFSELMGGLYITDSLLFLLIGAGLLLFGIFGAALFWLLRQVRREEHDIEVLEDRLRADEIQIHKYQSGTVREGQSVSADLKKDAEMTRDTQHRKVL